MLQIGQSCDYPNNLWTGSHLLAQQAQLVNATSQTIMAGPFNDEHKEDKEHYCYYSF